MSEDNTATPTKGPKQAKRASNISETAVVKLLVTENPKREDSQAWARFQHYFSLAEGATVADAIAAGLTAGDIKYDVIHGYISVEGAEVEEYQVTPRGAKSASVNEDDEGADAEEVDADEADAESETGF